MEAMDGRRRAVIECITPQVDGGRFAIKRVPGEIVSVEADVFCDGHDLPACALQYRHASQPADSWHEVSMSFLVNDRWRAEFSAAAAIDQLDRLHHVHGGPVVDQTPIP